MDGKGAITLACHSVHPPPVLLVGGGVSLLQNFKKGGLTGSQFLEGGLLGKRG